MVGVLVAFFFRPPSTHRPKASLHLSYEWPEHILVSYLIAWRSLNHWEKPFHSITCRAITRWRGLSDCGQHFKAAATKYAKELMSKDHDHVSLFFTKNSSQAQFAPWRLQSYCLTFILVKYLKTEVAYKTGNLLDYSSWKKYFYLSWFHYWAVRTKIFCERSYMWYVCFRYSCNRTSGNWLCEKFSRRF